MFAIFTADEFVFNGRSCYEFGLVLCDFNGKGQDDVSFGTVGSISETVTGRRISPVFHGVNYHKKPLEFKLVFGTAKDLDRYQLQEISMWLLGHRDYKWLQICQPDMEHLLYRCIITELTPMSVGWYQHAFTATVRCDGAYAYGFPFETSYTLAGEQEVLFRNMSTTFEYLKPTLRFTPSGDGNSIKIVNRSDGDRAFELTDIPSGSVVDVNNMNGIICDLENGANLYSGFNGNFFRLVHGDNDLVLTGTGTLTISGRFLYNVGA